MNPELFRAATTGNVEHLKHVLAEKNTGNLDQVTPTKDTIIHLAAGHGQLEFVKYVQSRCLPHLFIQANFEGDTPFHVAARAGHSEMIHLLISCVHTHSLAQRDAELGVTEVHHGILRMRNKSGDTPMHDAVRNHRLEVVKLLMEQDPELLCIDNDAGESPLHAAVELLRIDNCTGKSPSLLQAAVELLRLDSYTGKSSLRDTVELEKLATVKEILRSSQYSHNGPNGRTALHAAIIHNRPDVAELLLEKNGDLAKVGDDNNTSPLHLATTFGYLELIKLLLKYDTSATSLFGKNGMAPVHIAALYGRIDMIEEFIQCCPGLQDLLDRKRRNLLHLAIEGKELLLIKYILRRKDFTVALNQKDNDSCTPLHRATISCQPYVVNLLVEDNRVDRMALNGEGLSALEIAISQSEDGTAKPGKILVRLALLHAARPAWCKTIMPYKAIIRYIIGRKLLIERYKNGVNALLVVAALVAGVTFTAGFTMPGGYESEDGHGKNKGVAILAHKGDFKGFITHNAAALYCSTVAAIALIGVQAIDNILITAVMFYFAQLLTMASLALQVKSFQYGVKLAVEENEYLYDLISIRTSAFFIVLGLIIAALKPLFPLLYCSRRYVYFRSWLNQTVVVSDKLRNSYEQRLKDVSLLLSYKEHDE